MKPPISIKELFGIWRYSRRFRWRNNESRRKKDRVDEQQMYQKLCELDAEKILTKFVTESKITARGGNVRYADVMKVLSGKGYNRPKNDCRVIPEDLIGVAKIVWDTLVDWHLDPVLEDDMYVHVDSLRIDDCKKIVVRW